MSDTTEHLLIALVITVIVGVMAVCDWLGKRKAERERDDIWALAAALGADKEE